MDIHGKAQKNKNYAKLIWWNLFSVRAWARALKVERGVTQNEGIILCSVETARSRGDKWDAVYPLPSHRKQGRMWSLVRYAMDEITTAAWIANHVPKHMNIGNLHNIFVTHCWVGRGCVRRTPSPATLIAAHQMIHYIPYTFERIIHIKMDGGSICAERRPWPSSTAHWQRPPLNRP